MDSLFWGYTDLMWYLQFNVIYTYTHRLVQKVHIQEVYAANNFISLHLYFVDTKKSVRDPQAPLLPVGFSL